MSIPSCCATSPAWFPTWRSARAPSPNGKEQYFAHSRSGERCVTIAGALSTSTSGRARSSTNDPIAPSSVRVSTEVHEDSSAVEMEQPGILENLLGSDSLPYRVGIVGGRVVVIKDDRPALDKVGQNWLKGCSRAAVVVGIDKG